MELLHVPYRGAQLSLTALLSGSAGFLDVAVVLALVGFLATVCLARYLERRILLKAEELT